MTASKKKMTKAPENHAAIQSPAILFAENTTNERHHVFKKPSSTVSLIHSVVSVTLDNR
jgi:hypothetical protein